MADRETTSVPIRAGFNYASDPALLASHRDEWSRLREEASIFRVPQSSGDAWYLLSYDDIRNALQDWELFSSDFTAYMEGGHKMIPENLDPPEHTKYRRLLTSSFSPAAVRAWEPRVRSVCVELIDGFRHQGACDVVKDFGLQFPTAIFMEMMGLSLERGDEFIARAQTLLHTTDADDPGGSLRVEAAMQIFEDIAELVAERRRRPADDLVSHLVVSQVDGRALSDEDLGGMGLLLYLAGLDTVASMLAYSLRHLAEHPGLRRTLVDQPELIPSAVEEFLRYYSIATTPRVVTRDAEFGGCPMKRGDQIIIPTASAGRDSRQFPDADHFVVDREPNRHLAFGDGPHRCAGIHLARMELGIALEEWHRRIPDYRVADDAVIIEHVGNVAGLSAVPIVWD
jgi:cytochrome P450